MNKEKSSKRGFAAMGVRRRKQIASLGGRSQGKQTNSGNFANNPARAAEAGKKGGSKQW